MPSPYTDSDASAHALTAGGSPIAPDSDEATRIGHTHHGHTELGPSGHFPSLQTQKEADERAQEGRFGVEPGTVAAERLMTERGTPAFAERRPGAPHGIIETIKEKLV
ncbi:hypothetical protein AJ80_06696 [Polytolypa hystricis UAMH7299]|uniref:Uncharacterized protein n=1 Tax=Polytolypa hystricis (strain UAMH7299) TaxID=1447883 RepID=A0A2B7XUB9_POLH7|nr:hypothetical protein AJ80_06696 [Polytolypa hystricis UAMH7299]